MPVSSLPKSRLFRTLRRQVADRMLGGGVVADRHGVRRAPFRLSCGRFSCFR
jgi:hypothetical protein